jgi:hypothetical protein
MILVLFRKIVLDRHIFTDRMNLISGELRNENIQAK